MAPPVGQVITGGIIRMRSGLLVGMFCTSLVAAVCQTPSVLQAQQPSLESHEAQKLLRTHVVLLPYDASEIGANWRIGFLLDSQTVIGPAAAIAEQSFIVATVNRHGIWDSSVVRGRSLNDCVFAAKLSSPAQEVVDLKIGEDPRKYLDEIVVFASFNGDRTIPRAGLLNGFSTASDTGEFYLDIGVKAMPGDIGGIVLAPNGELLGIVCDSPFTPKDGLSIVALSALDIAAVIKGEKRPDMKDSEGEAEVEGNIESRLRQLKDLYDKGLITEEEYDKKQRDILEAL